MSRTLSEEMEYQLLTQGKFDYDKLTPNLKKKFTEEQAHKLYTEKVESHVRYTIRFTEGADGRKQPDGERPYLDSAGDSRREDLFRLGDPH